MRVNECKTYIDFLNTVNNFNKLKKVSKTVRKEINQVIYNTKLRLNNSKFIDLDLDYNLSILLYILYWGAKDKNQLEKVKDDLEHIISFELDVHRQKRSGETTLILSAMVGANNLIPILLKKGAAVYAQNHLGSSALMLAAIKDHKEIVEMLIIAGADVNCKNRDNQTLLILAEQNGHQSIVEMLMKADAHK